MNLLAEMMSEIFEGYADAQREFALVVDADKAAGVIDDFRKLVDRNQFAGNERNIDYWRKAGWEAFSRAVSVVGGKTTSTQQKRKKAVGKSMVVTETEGWLIVVPLDKNASCFYGKTSSWCTTKDNSKYFEDYFYDRDVVLVYCLEKSTGAMWALAVYAKTIEIFDIDDNKITASEFQEDTQLSLRDIVAVVRSDRIQDAVADARELHAERGESLRDAVAGVGGVDTDLEKEIVAARDVAAGVWYTNAVTKSGHEVISPALLGVLVTNPDPGQLKAALAAVDVDMPFGNFLLTRVANIGQFVATLNATVFADVIRLLQGTHPVIDAEIVRRRGFGAIEYVMTNADLLDKPNGIDPRVLAWAIDDEPKIAAMVNDHLLAAVLSVAPELIRHVANPTLQQQRVAVKADPDVIDRIRNPHPDL